MSAVKLLFSVAILGISALIFAEESFPTPLESSHPMIGRWKIEFPKLMCSEEHEIRSNGTRSVVAGEERNEAELVISAVPSEAGFYKWTDKIVKNNGKPDCFGSTTEVGHISVNFIRMHSSKNRFLMCAEERMDTCFGEFSRIKSEGI